MSTETTVLDEAAKRRPDFDCASTPVLMADGREWFFPKPYVQLFPIVENGRVRTLGGRTTFGPEFDGLMKAVRDAETSVESVQAVFAVGCFLLGRNYDLADADLAGLFSFRFDDDGSMERLTDIIGVASGDGPKRPSAGAGSPS